MKYASRFGTDLSQIFNRSFSLYLFARNIRKSAIKQNDYKMCNLNIKEWYLIPLNIKSVHEPCMLSITDSI